MDIKSNAAYIKGLAEGLGIDKESKEGKIISALIDLVNDMAESITDLEAECAELREYAEELDEDLGDVEEFLLDEDDCDCGCDCDDDCDCGCCDDGYVELECPACNEIICLDDSLLDEDTIQCPACGETLEFDFDCDCDCDED